MSQRIYSIYKITNNINGKVYIGFTGGKPEKRWANHCKHGKGLITKSIKKHGKENFKFEVILQGWDREHILDMEVYFISHYNSYRGHGYNCTTGGENINFNSVSQGLFPKGRVVTEETRRKISKTLTGRKMSKEFCEKIRHRQLGKKLSPEHCKQISLRNKGKKLSEECKQKLRLANLGKVMPQEVRDRISDTLKGRQFTDDHRNKIGNAHSKEYLVIHPDGKQEHVHNLSVFCRTHSLNRGHMGEVVHGQRKHHKSFKVSEKTD